MTFVLPSTIDTAPARRLVIPAHGSARRAAEDWLRPVSIVAAGPGLCQDDGEGRGTYVRARAGAIDRICPISDIASHWDARLADREERPHLIGPSLPPVHERKDLNPSRSLRRVYYRRRRGLLLMAAVISNGRSLGPLDTKLLL